MRRNARRVALHSEQHDADTLVLGFFSCAKTDGAAAAVGIHKHIVLAQIHAIDSELVEQLGLLRVGLVERGRGDIEFATEQLVAHALGAIDDTSLLTQDGVTGASVDVLGNGDDMRIECGDSLKELLRMRQVALSGHEGDHNLVGTPTAADDGIAEQAQMLVLVKGGNVQTLGLMRDAVENLTGTRRLDRTLGTATILCVPRSKKPQRTAPSLPGAKGVAALWRKPRGAGYLPGSPRVTPIPRMGSTAIPSRSQSSANSSSIAACLAASCFL